MHILSKLPVDVGLVLLYEIAWLFFSDSQWCMYIDVDLIFDDDYTTENHG